MTTQTASKDWQHYPNLDWLRLLLATQVVAVHCGVSTASVLINPVPAFLAISGFAIMGSIQRRAPLQFFANRALRVLPLLFVSFGAVGALHGWSAMAHNIRFWIWPFGPPPVNPVVWSLIYEEIYYAVLCVLFVAGAYRLAWLPIVLAAGFLYAVTAQKFLGLPSPLYMLGAAFFVGNACFLWREKLGRCNPMLATIAFACVMLWSILLPYDIVRPPFAWFDCLSFIAMLIFAIAGPRLPRLKVDLSYSLYLVHCLVLHQFYGVLPLGWGMFAAVLICTLPICIAAWCLVERPALSLKRLHHRSVSTPAPAE